MFLLLYFYEEKLLPTFIHFLSYTECISHYILSHQLYHMYMNNLYTAIALNGILLHYILYIILLLCYYIFICIFICIHHFWYRQI